MCGILSVIRYDSTLCKNVEEIKRNFEKYNMRGPEQTDFIHDTDNKLILGFHRLAINGCAEPASMQPLMLNNLILICNGEIYNHKKLAKLTGSDCNTGSDCEIILHMYEKYGIEYTLKMLDGVFAFTLIDQDKNKVFIARDPFGVRPLFIWMRDANFVAPIVVASELKYGQNINNFTPRPFPPGHYIETYFRKSTKITLSQIRETCSLKYMAKPYYQINSSINTSINTKQDAQRIIRDSLKAAVEKRITSSNRDRGAACLLSGGLDSSLVAALVAKYLKENTDEKLHTWSIGMTGSEDLKYAKMVAEHIGSIHHEIELTEDDFINAIPKVIHDIESNDTTTVRASVGNWLISKYIKQGSQDKIVFNGDGSDEVAGGYLYFHYAPNPIEFDKECRRLLNDIHLFDVLRSDRSISNHGLEARTPFLDKNFVDTYFSIPTYLRDHKHCNKCEKYLLREAFKDSGLLPNEILFRTKEAFSDGVSTDKKAWFEIIQEYASSAMNIDDKKIAEQAYYDKIFSQYYGSQNSQHIMPYKWMPNFIDATDASARTLDVYNKINSENNTENDVIEQSAIV
jgi:asparagine synthase (glutamine-hydrolysing)